MGNTVVVVEHDAAMMKESDYIVDFGPGAGKHGGEVIAYGTPTEIEKNPKSITGQYLSGKKKIEISRQLQITEDLKNSIKIVGANQFNLKNVDVTFPLGKLVSITGVSGSGKSTLLVETLYPALQKELNYNFRGEVGGYKKIEGLEILDKAILIDQSPIGRTPEVIHQPIRVCLIQSVMYLQRHGTQKQQVTKKAGFHLTSAVVGVKPVRDRVRLKLKCNL